MKALFSELRSALVSTLVLGVVCCGAYPVLVWGLAQAVFKDKANGRLGKVRAQAKRERRWMRDRGTTELERRDPLDT